MKNLLTSALFAGLIATAAPLPALAQSGTVVSGVAVANLDAVIANSNAFRTAQQQRATTYKAQIDQANARRTQIEAQLQPLITKFNADRAQANANQQALAQQAGAIQSIQQNGQQELQRILAPVAMSEAYVNEQIEDKLNDAVKNAMNKQKVSLLLSQQAIIASNNNAYNLNQAILTELNTLIPSASITPPSGWQPREIREQQQQGAAQQAPAAQQPAPAPTTQPQGR